MNSSKFSCIMMNVKRTTVKYIIYLPNLDQRVDRWIDMKMSMYEEILMKLLPSVISMLVPKMSTPLLMNSCLRNSIPKTST